MFGLAAAQISQHTRAAPGLWVGELVATARAQPGQKPAGGFGAKTVVTSLVVGVDQVAHTLSLVDPVGGAIRTVNVVTPQGQQSLKLVKVGDTITAIFSEALLIAAEPAA